MSFAAVGVEVGAALFLKNAAIPPWPSAVSLTFSGWSSHLADAGEFFSVVGGLNDCLIT